METDERFVRSIKLQNLLSFGNESPEIELGSLNILIGPNASGKSNFIEAFSLLRALPTDLAGTILDSGGIGDWLWKSERRASPTAEIMTTVHYPSNSVALRYRINFTQVGQRLELVDEAVEDEWITDPSKNDVRFYYRYQKGHPVLNVRTVETNPANGSPGGTSKRTLRREDLSPDQSVLSQRKDPDLYPELTYLSKQLAQIKLYREWNLGRNTDPRRPQPASLPEDFLRENADNLGLVLNNLQHYSGVEQTIRSHLKEFYASANYFSTRIQGGTVQLFLHETGPGEPIIPATRLSDGTIRYLCLLSILCHPSPPPLVCIEEPELGLHPDILPKIAELLLEASKRTQLIVTTHSSKLVSAFTHIPETVVVCERGDQGTDLRRLESKPLLQWLQNYSLGELWEMGEIGGARW